MTTPRRPDGALEDAVLRVLWAHEAPLLPAVIRSELPMTLAYTSVATVLTRLVEKGLVQRQPVGHAFAYSAAVNEATLVAQRISAVLEQSSNRQTALAGFVGQLSQREAAMLRTLLENAGFEELGK